MKNKTQSYFCNKCKTKRFISDFAIDNSRKRGHSSTCKNCKRAYSKQVYEKRVVSIDCRWQQLKSAAKRKNIRLDLNKKEYEKLVKNKNCYYCEKDLKLEKGYSLDRKDNSDGYTLNNVLPCCGRCNMTRQDRFTVEEWLIAMQALKKWGEGRT